MSDTMHVATRKGLFTLARGPAGWSVVEADFLGDPVTMVLHDPRDRTLYAALNHGHFGVKLHRRRGGGAWEEIGTPAYPVPDGAESGPALKQVWELTPGGADQPGRLWAGTLPGGLFRSDDAGATWTLNAPLWERPEREHWFGGGYPEPGIHTVLVHPDDARDLTVGVSCGGVWRSADDGATWSLEGEGLRAEYMPPERAGDPTIQDPHLVARCDADPRRLYIQHHNGIFRSDDAGATWTELRPEGVPAFGFAVAVHPTDPDTAWFVPAIKDETRIPQDGAVVVTRTRDAGRTFDVLRKGLPQHHAYDLVFRHALDVDEKGNSLAFGSTTGALWTSDDQGESWSCVNAHLPPVYVVRFA